VRFVAGDCTACGACIAACPFGAATADEDGKPLVCVYCGTCARYCPHGVLALEEIGGDTRAAD